MTYKIAICDDEEEFVASLREQVTKILQNSGISFDIESFSSGEELLSYIRKNSVEFDLIFMDIFMKEINGIDAAKDIRLTNDSTAIIFTTSSSQHILAGYEVQALQYLLKPIDGQALEVALDIDLKRRFQNQYFVFKSGGMTVKVPFEEIEYIESMIKSVKLVTKQSNYVIRTGITEIEHRLPQKWFCRSHRGFIINLQHISKMSTQNLTTISGTELPIGKTYARNLKRAFLDYIGD